MASMVVDLMLYNGNVDKFIQVAFLFENSLAGILKNWIKARPFSTALYDLRKLKNAVRLILEGVVLILFGYFSVQELRFFANVGPADYFKDPMKLLDCVSLGLCFSAILFYISLVFNYTFSHFEFKPQVQAVGTEPDGYVSDLIYSNLEELAVIAASVNRVVAINICCLFVRSLTFLESVSPTWGILITTIGRGGPNLLAFIFLFFVVFFGFSLAGYFIFGANYGGMSTVPNSVMRCFIMLSGHPKFDKLQQADPQWSTPFFYVFYIGFLLVLSNLFISIVLSAYKREVARINAMGHLEDPISQLVGFIEEAFIKRFSALKKLQMVKYMGKGLGVRRISPDRVKELMRLKEEANRPCSSECWGIVVFFAIFIVFIYMQSRTMTVYHIKRLSELAIEESRWQMTLKGSTADWETSFQRVSKMNQVEEFMREVIQERLFTHFDHETRYLGFTNQMGGPWQSAVGVHSLVRMTIQLACYRKNDIRRYKYGYYFLRTTPNEYCPSEPCSRNNEDPCRNYYGERYKRSQYKGRFKAPISRDTYYYSPNKNTYLRVGGYPLALGVDKGDVERNIFEIVKDGVFTPDVVSLVFDWVTYSGNLDVFGYSKAEFSLSSTGQIKKSFSVRTFPLNFYHGGHWYVHSRRAILALQVLYVLFVAYYISNLLRDLYRQKLLSSAKGRRTIGAIIDFYSNDAWNISDSISLVLSVLTIVYWLLYICPHPRVGTKPFPWRYEIPSIDRLRRQRAYLAQGLDSLYRPPFSVNATLGVDNFDDIFYPLDEFSVSSSTYDVFTKIAGVNTFFVSIRVLKYMQHLPTIGVMARTLGESAAQIINFTFLIVLLLVGFPVMFHVEYGTQFAQFRNVPQAMITLFRYMIGSFDVSAMYENDPIFTAVLFVLFMLLFFFILVNMYLAIMITKWRMIVAQQQGGHQTKDQKIRPSAWARYRTLSRSAAALREAMKDKGKRPTFVSIWTKARNARMREGIINALKASADETKSHAVPESDALVAIEGHPGGKEATAAAGGDEGYETVIETMSDGTTRLVKRQSAISQFSAKVRAITQASNTAIIQSVTQRLFNDPSGLSKQLIEQLDVSKGPDASLHLDALVMVLGSHRGRLVFRQLFPSMFELMLRRQDPLKARMSIRTAATPHLRRQFKAAKDEVIQAERILDKLELTAKMESLNHQLRYYESRLDNAKLYNWVYMEYITELERRIAKVKDETEAIRTKTKILVDIARPLIDGDMLGDRMSSRCSSALLAVPE
mmetsp:Transcript_4009/g.9141  ORF Transcript_4009/g.9141 Transcript_4009/m.9141 type:complete len:1250 (+) Transcript_4009:267-4016(+)